MFALDLFNTPYERALKEGAVDKVVSEGGPYDLPGIDYDRPGDTPRKPRSSGSTTPRRHDDDPDFMDPDQRRLRADQERVRKANAEYHAKKKPGVAEGGENVNEFAAGGGGGSGNYFQALASAWYNGAFDTGSLQKGIKSKEDVERLLNRGIVAPDGKIRKYAIDYNSDFDGVVISSDDYYEHADYNDQGQEVDSRTGQKWGPYDHMEFSDEDLSEGINEVDRRGFLKGVGAAAVGAGAGYVGGVRKVQNTTLARVLGKLNGFLKPLKASKVKDKWAYELITRTQELIQKYKIDSNIYNDDLYSFGENQGERAYSMAFRNGIQTSQDREKYEAMLFELSADLMNATSFHGKYINKESVNQGVAEETKPYGDYKQSPRAFGAGNFQRIVRANMGNLPTVTLEFADPNDNIVLDRKGVDLISDYYDGLTTDAIKNHFIYRVLPSADEVLTVLKKLGWNQAVQPELPGIPKQGELPLQEKKKFNSNSDVAAGDVKVARELQKLRAQYPAAKSDVEAVAKAEIDSNERSQQQLSAIKGANTEQDRLLQQLVDLDRKQGKEIGSLDNENDRLEQQLAHVDQTNARLAQAIGQMSGRVQSGSTGAPQSRVIDMLPNSPADKSADTSIQPTTVPEPSEPQEPRQKSKSDAMSRMAQSLGNQTRRVQGIDQGPAPSIRGNVTDLDAFRRAQAAVTNKNFNPMAKAMLDKGVLTRTGTDEGLLGFIANKKPEPKKKSEPVDPMIAKIVSNRQNPQSRVPGAKAKVYHGYDEYNRAKTVGDVEESTVNELSTDKLAQYKTAAALDAGAADKRGDYERGDKRFAGIVKATKKQFANDLKKHGQQGVAEGSSTASDAVERAILNRIMTQHTDLLMKFGPDKVMQAAEEVAYGVGDVDEIGTSDVSAYVNQVKQILGA